MDYPRPVALLAGKVQRWQKICRMICLIMREMFGFGLKRPAPCDILVSVLLIFGGNVTRKDEAVSESGYYNGERFRLARIGASSKAAG